MPKNNILSDFEWRMSQNQKDDSLLGFLLSKPTLKNLTNKDSSEIVRECVEKNKITLLDGLTGSHVFKVAINDYFNYIDLNILININNNIDNDGDLRKMVRAQLKNRNVAIERQ